MKIAFVWFWNRASEIKPLWHDGYTAAWNEVGKKHKVDWYLDEKLPSLNSNYDFICYWGDSNCPAIKALENHPARKGICLTTDPTNIDNLAGLDVVFCESKPIYEYLRAKGRRTILAFGTDTDFFDPYPLVNKDIEYFYPATFSPWKRQNEIAYLGDKLLCVGTIQPDGEEIYKECKDKGVRIEVGYFPAEKIKEYYKRSKKILIPAVHGSERTVLEAMSMNIPVEITNGWNKRAKSYINEFEDSNFESAREFVVNRYSHIVFANNLLKGIEA